MAAIWQKAQWRKSSYSEGSNKTSCVEVARAVVTTGVRDTKDVSHPDRVLAYPSEAWTVFLRSALGESGT